MPSLEVTRGTKMWIAVIAVIVGVVFVAVIVPALVHRAIGPNLDERIAKVYRQEQVILKDVRALSLGLESTGVTQARGNGALVVTANELHWFQFTPSWDLRIPRASITAVQTRRSHLGKSLAKDLLYVAFVIDGKPDSFAWNVTDLPAWLAELGKSSGSASK